MGRRGGAGNEGRGSGTWLRDLVWDDDGEDLDPQNNTARIPESELLRQPLSLSTVRRSSVARI